MIFILMDGCSDSLVEQQSCLSFKLVCIRIILLLLANHGLLRFKLLGRNVDLLQVMAPKRQNQHDSLRKFNITAVFLLLLVACKPTTRLFVRKLKSTISWELQTRRWHHCYKMTLDYPKPQGMSQMLLWSIYP